MNEKEDPRVSDIIDNPDAAINKPEWTDMAVSQSIETGGPNAGNLTYPAAVRHAEFVQADRQDLADFNEFRETINAAVAMDAAYFATPDITQEEAVRRLMWAREKAEAAVNQAKLIQHTADMVRGTNPDFKPPEPGSPTPESTEQSEKIDEPEVVLESSLKGATTTAEIKAAIKAFGKPIEGSQKSYNNDVICELIDKSQGHRAWIDYITNAHGLRDAVIRVLAPSDQQAPEPESPTPAIPEVKKGEDQQRRIQVPPPR